ncbi:hypothetical protein ACVRZR_09180 [Streptococcus entericus]|uniref:hypothetical protein n=1 Tax=Streptococcus entericus TaxID=155680 RepID=UPI000369DDDD|nr:hypothetical protein [Streptococcus entericus]
MEFKIKKKYLLDIASLRLDCKVREINRERKVVSNREYYWEHGINKKQKPKYSMLSNEEIYSSNAPLIGQIRSGKINKNILRLVVRKSPTGESTHYFFHSQDDKVEVSC